MKRLFVVDNVLMDRPAEKFLSGLAAVVGDRFETRPGILVEVSDEELAGMIERILNAAGTEYFPSLETKPAEQVEPSAHEIAEQIIERRAKGQRRVVRVEGETFRVPNIPPEGNQAGNGHGQKQSKLQPRICVDCGKEFQPKRVDQVHCTDPDCKKNRHRKWSKQSDQREKVGESQEPVGKGIEKVCPYCGDTFRAWRKDSVSCSKADCRKKHKVEANKARRQGKKQAVEIEQPAAVEIAAVETQPMEKPEEFISAIDGLPEPKPSDPEPALPVEPKPIVEKPVNGFSWLVVDGPRAGTWLTGKQLKNLLDQGNLRTGQHIQHHQRGLALVRKSPGDRSQKLVWEFGDQAEQEVTAKELTAKNN